MKSMIMANCIVGVLFGFIVGCDNRTQEELASEVGLPVYAVVPYDSVVAEYDRSAKPLLQVPEDSVAVKALQKLHSVIA